MKCSFTALRAAATVEFVLVMNDPEPVVPALSVSGDIHAVAFTGKDTAAGNSYAAWQRAREAARAPAKPPP